MKNHASHGSQSDVYGQFFDKAFYERFNMNNDEYLILKENEGKDKKKDGDKASASTSITPKPKEIKIDLDGLWDRKERLTINSSDLSDAVITRNGEQLFYLSKFEKGYD